MEKRDPASIHYYNISSISKYSNLEKWKNFRITIRINIYNMTEKEVCRKNIFVQRTSVQYSIYGKLEEEG